MPPCCAEGERLQGTAYRAAIAADDAAFAAYDARVALRAHRATHGGE